MLTAPDRASGGQDPGRSGDLDDGDHAARVVDADPPTSPSGAEATAIPAPVDPRSDGAARGGQDEGSADASPEAAAPERPESREGETPREPEADDLAAAPYADDLEVDFGAPSGSDAEGASRTQGGYDPLRDSPEALKARHWTIAGIASTVVGAALGAGAVATVAVDPCLTGGGNNCFEDARNRAAGIMAVPAAVLVLGGLGMVGYGAIQRRKLRASVASDGMTTMLTLHGRF